MKYRFKQKDNHLYYLQQRKFFRLVDVEKNGKKITNASRLGIKRAFEVFIISGVEFV